MNNRNHNRNQQNNGYQQGNGYQQQNRYQQSDPHRWERQNLERELRQLQRQLTLLDARIDAVGAQGVQLEADLLAHNQAIPATIAMEIGRALANALRVPYLPSAARGWYYKRERMLQIQNNLKYQAIALFHQREALVQQIDQLMIEIDLLNYHS